MSSDRISLKAKSVAVIGAGPSGAIAAKYLRAERVFDKIVLFEQRSGPGGIWTYTPDQTDEDLFTIPQLDPTGKNQEPVWKPASHAEAVKSINGTNGISQYQNENRSRDANRTNGTHHTNGTHTSDVTHGVNGTSKVPSFLSPLYSSLETNIPLSLMRFSDHPWPSSIQLFPHHSSVLSYINSYSAPVQDLVQYSTQVTSAVPLSDSPNTQWRITSRNLLTKEEKEEVFDALIVANGHFITPFIPAMPGLQEWHAQHPGSISHSKYFRSATSFTGQKVIVIGNSASGADISSQISKTCSKPLLWSSRSKNLFSGTHTSTFTERKPVVEISSLDASARSVTLVDGTTESNIDAIVFCTGYFYSLPFLPSSPSHSPFTAPDGSHIPCTYQHIFHAFHPTLSFLALPQRVIPFPVAEAQAAVVARVLAGRLSLPPSQTMQEWYETALAGTQRRKDFHLLPFPRDGEYINMLAAWAGEADGECVEGKAVEAEGHGRGSVGIGKTPPRWGAWEFWCRENFPAIRAKFGEMGEKRKEIRSVEEVGFVFEKKRDGGGESAFGYES